MNKQELDLIIEKHRLWLNDENGGERASLNCADLHGAILSYASLSYADLRGARISYADSRVASLRVEFSDREILEMDGKRALKFWKETKDFIKMTIEKFPAIPSKANRGRK